MMKSTLSFLSLSLLFDVDRASRALVSLCVCVCVCVCVCSSLSSSSRGTR